jgi:hypothetical protein
MITHLPTGGDLPAAPAGDLSAELLLARHAVLHDFWLGGIWDQVPPALLCVRPHPQLNSLAWNLWHIARCEDIAGRFVGGLPQLFDLPAPPAGRARATEEDAAGGSEDKAAGDTGSRAAGDAGAAPARDAAGDTQGGTAGKAAGDTGSRAAGDAGAGPARDAAGATQGGTAGKAAGDTGSRAAGDAGAAPARDAAGATQGGTRAAARAAAGGGDSAARRGAPPTWGAWLNLPWRHLGSGMTLAEVDVLNAAIDLEALRAYSAAVAARTRALVAGLGEDDLRCGLDPVLLRHTLYYEGVAYREPATLLRLYSGWSKGVCLFNLALTHSYQHLGEMGVLATLLGVEFD